MKCTTVIDKSREEEVIIYLHGERDIERRIRELLESESTELVGYGDGVVVKLRAEDIYSVSVEDGSAIADTVKGRLKLRQRLYVLEELLGSSFIKINQSCLVRIDAIERFDVSFGGALMVIMKNGRKDYVSRRQVKTVKERIGFKI